MTETTTAAGDDDAARQAAPADEPARQAALGALLASVAQRPGSHDFFALLRQVDALRPQAPRTGHALRPQQEALRFGQPPSLNFAPTPLAGLEWRSPLAPRLSVRFFGLLGPQGPMPLHLSDFLQPRSQTQVVDGGPAHFLDIFNHRLISLFYRAWAQAQPVVQADRPQDDRFLAWLLAAAGQHADAGVLPARALAFHAGLLAGRTRHPEALCKVLQAQFEVPVALVPHVGHWMAIEPEDHSHLGFARNRPERASAQRVQLGRAPEPGSAGWEAYRRIRSRLGAVTGSLTGEQAVAGRRIWDRQYRFRLQLGPLTLAQYNSFLPGGPDWRLLNAWVGQLAGPSLRWELELLLAPTQRPAPRLAAPGRPGTRLGVSTWLGHGPNTGLLAPSPPSVQRPRPPARRLRLRPGTSFLQRQSGA